MALIRSARHHGLVLACAAILAASVPAAAQDSDPNPGALTITGSYDVLNQYMFRGIRQNSTKLAMWPVFDLGLGAYSGDGGLKSVGINIGSWNSLHTGDTGLDGPSGKLWYESDFYASFTLGFGGGVSFGTTYTAYTSPNSGFSTVKEIAVKLAVDDSARLGKGAVKPYVLVAFEMDTGPGTGQADAGGEGGTYVELGVSPGYSGARASVAFPVKVGLSASNYYEHPVSGADNKFGYFSVAALATVPLGGTTRFGAWNVHGGVEYQALGASTKAFNGGDASQVIGSFGIGFSY
jgi:hypothetical protein